MNQWADPDNFGLKLGVLMGGGSISGVCLSLRVKIWLFRNTLTLSAQERGGQPCLAVSMWCYMAESRVSQRSGDPWPTPGPRGGAGGRHVPDETLLDLGWNDLRLASHIQDRCPSKSNFTLLWKQKNDITFELVVGSGRFLDETGGFRSWRIHFRCPFGSQGEDFMTRLPDEVGRGVTWWPFGGHKSQRCSHQGITTMNEQGFYLLITKTRNYANFT